MKHLPFTILMVAFVQSTVGHEIYNNSSPEKSNNKHIASSSDNKIILLDTSVSFNWINWYHEGLECCSQEQFNKLLKDSSHLLQLRFNDDTTSVALLFKTTQTCRAVISILDRTPVQACRILKCQITDKGSQRIVVSLTGIPSGRYLIRVKLPEQILYQRLIIQ